MYVYTPSNGKRVQQKMEEYINKEYFFHPNSFNIITKPVAVTKKLVYFSLPDYDNHFHLCLCVCFQEQFSIGAFGVVKGNTDGINAKCTIFHMPSHPRSTYKVVLVVIVSETFLDRNAETTQFFSANYESQCILYGFLLEFSDK